MSQSESLVKRLAGPSTGKAGLVKDQTDINAIIAEVSKGSKFYENERRKDKELTQRIARIHGQLEERRKGIDLARIETATDKLLAELEAQRDLSQSIVHVDMDAFYASVEILHNPDLKDKPFGVGSKSGVLTTASYQARKFGVRSGMAGFVAAKLCPHLIFVPNVFSRYAEMSKKVMDIFKRYDTTMAVAGCDEGYLNLTPYCQQHGQLVDDVVDEMRAKVYEETSLTVSAGIAPNKMLAKICSDKNKPNGQFHLPFEKQSITEFVQGLSIRKIPGIGRVNERLLEAMGVKTCGDIFERRADLYLLSAMKVVSLSWLLSIHLGISSNVVCPSSRDERRSIGAERTFSTLSDHAKIMGKLEEVVEELSSDMKDGGWAGKTITLKYKLDTFEVSTRSKSFDRWIHSKEDLWTIGRELLLAEGPLKLRLLGLRMTRLKDLKVNEGSEASGIKRFLKPPSNLGPGPEEAEGSTPKKDATFFNTLSQAIDVDAEAEDEDEDENDELPSVALRTHADDKKTVIAQDLASAKNVAEEKEWTFFASSSPEPEFEPEPQTIPAVSKASPPPPQMVDVTCPICGSALSETTNDKVNSHIDFCLSKGAIRAAARAPTPTPTSPKKRPRLDRDISSGSGNGSTSNKRTNARTKEREAPSKKMKSGLDAFLVPRSEGRTRSTSPEKKPNSRSNRS